MEVRLAEEGSGIATISGRTRMSSRGQVVIPKALRDAAGLDEGVEVEVIFDGERLILAPYPGNKGPTAIDHSSLALETRAGYRVRGSLPPRLPDELRPSKVWAARVRAVERIKELRQASYVPDLEEILAESRRELRGEDVDD